MSSILLGGPGKAFVPQGGVKGVKGEVSGEKRNIFAFKNWI